MLEVALDKLLERFQTRPFSSGELVSAGIDLDTFDTLLSAGYVVRSGKLYKVDQKFTNLDRDLKRMSRNERIRDRMRRGLKIWIFLALCAFGLIDFAFFSNESIVSKYLKFSVIVACSILAFLIHDELHDKRDKYTIQFAAFLTVIADFLIGILDLFIFGLACFILVHSIYAFRHLRGFTSLKKELTLAVPVFLGSGVILYLAAPITQNAGIFVPSIVYGLFLATSLYAGLGVKIRRFFPGRDQNEILKGIILFFIADILVAMNAGVEGEAKSWTGILIWLFYLPAQYFLCMSGYKRNPVV